MQTASSSSASTAEREVKGLLLVNTKQILSFYSRKRCEGFAACKRQAALQLLQQKEMSRACCLQIASSSSTSTAETDVKGLLLANRKQRYSFYSRKRSKGFAACKRQAALQLRQRREKWRGCCFQTASISSASTAENEVEGLPLANGKQLCSF